MEVVVADLIRKIYTVDQQAQKAEEGFRQALINEFGTSHKRFDDNRDDWSKALWEAYLARERLNSKVLTLMGMVSDFKYPKIKS